MDNHWLDNGGTTVYIMDNIIYNYKKILGPRFFIMSIILPKKVLIDGALISEGGRLFHCSIIRLVKNLNLISRFDLGLNNL